MYITFYTYVKHFSVGLSMRLLETKDDLHFFTFEHSKQYQSVQIQFIEAVESFNPDNIVVRFSINKERINNYDKQKL